MHQVFQSFGIVPAPLRPFFYGAFLLALLLFSFGLASRLSIWLQGSSEPKSGVSHRGLVGLLGLSVTRIFSPDCLFARRLFIRSRWRGTMLLLIIWGSLLVLAASLFSLATWATPGLRPPLALHRLLGLAGDLGGGFLLLGLLGALARRYLFKPRIRVFVAIDGWLLWLLFLILLLGFVLKGLKLSYMGLSGLAWHPVGSAFGALVHAIATGLEWQPADLYQVLYLVHAASALLLIAYLPFSKLFHLFAAQVTTYAASQRRKQVRDGQRGTPTAPGVLFLRRGAQ